MAMEELELTDAQAKALLESPSPLAIYIVGSSVLLQLPMFSRIGS